jgi:hypothetical protein
VKYVNNQDKAKRLEFWSEALQLAKSKMGVISAHATVDKALNELSIEEQIELYKHLTLGCLGEIEGEDITDEIL